MLYWLLLLSYVFLASVSFFFLGINWYTVETKYRRSPQGATAVLYITNTIMLYLVFDLPFLVQFILSLLNLGGVYMGTYFQCIGLTGGIATGKSTVSNLLAENGCDIIDSDKISKEVGTLCIIHCV